MSEATRENAIDLWTHFKMRYGTRVVTKRDAPLMQNVAAMLEQAGIQQADRFMRRFATTIGTTIYLPYEVGSTERPYWDQIEICVHEHTHVVQARRDGVRYLVNYIANGADRASYEAEAYATEIELRHWRTGRIDIDDPRHLSTRLDAYGCTRSEIALAERILIARARGAARGAYEGEATRVAIRWMEAFTPYLRDRDRP